MNHIANSVALAEDYANWMRGRSWDHFATLTFDSIVSSQTAARIVTNTFIRNLEQTVQNRVDYFGSIELGRETQRPHAHLVLAGTSSIDAPSIVSRWLKGRSVVDTYDANRAGVWYVGKGLDDERTVLLLRDFRDRIR